MLKFDIPNFDYCKEHLRVFFIHPPVRPNFCMYFSQYCVGLYVILMFVENMFFSSLLNYFKIANFDFLYLGSSFFKKFCNGLMLYCLVEQ